MMVISETKTISPYLKPYSCFISVRSKQKVVDVPKGVDWNNNLLTWDQANEMLSKGNNIGLVAGYGLICIDCDSVEFSEAVRQLLPTTYEETTPSGGTHFIFECNEDVENISINWNGRHMGEIRAKRQYVVISPSEARSKVDNKLITYIVKVNTSPATITKEDIGKILTPFQSQENESSKSVKLDNSILKQIESDTELYDLFKGKSIDNYASRSEAEQSLTNKLRARDFDKETALKVVLNSDIGKLREKSKSYWDLMWDKSLVYVTESKPDWKEGENQILKKELPVMTIKDYRTYRDRKDWLIKDLGAFPNEITMRTGNTGSFKSLEMNYRAICMATGKPYLDKFKTRKINVLIISAENPERTDGNRFLKIMRELKIRKLPNLYVIPRRASIDLLNPSFQNKLSNLIEEKNIKALFIDTINPATPELDDNAAKDVTRLFNNFLKPFTEKYGLYTEYLHHTDKAGKRYLGSMKWKGNVDNEWFVERKQLRNEFTIQNSKNRSGEIESLKVGVTFLDDRIRFNLIEQKGIGRNEYKKTQSPKDRAKYHTKKILERSVLPYKDLITSVMKESKASESTTKKAIKELTIQNILIKNNKGEYVLQ